MKTAARNQNGAGSRGPRPERGEERPQDEARDVEGGDASEVGTDMFGSRVITIRRMAGPTMPLPRPSRSRARRKAQNSVATALAIIANPATMTPPRTIDAMWPRSA